MLLVGVLIFGSFAVLFTIRRQRLTALAEEIDDMRTGIDLVHTRGAVYQELLAEKNRREGRLSDQPVLFSTLIESAEAEAGVSAGNQEVQAAVDLTDTLRVRAVTFDLRGVTLDQLTKFLGALESNQQSLLLTRNLLIRSPSAAEDRLNVDLEVATWERITAGAGGGEGETAP